MKLIIEVLKCVNAEHHGSTNQNSNENRDTNPERNPLETVCGKLRFLDSFESIFHLLFQKQRGEFMGRVPF